MTEDQQGGSRRPPARVESSGGRAPMVGRDAQRRWIEDRLGRGGPVLIVGEAGVGKTRLMDDVLDRAAESNRCVGRVAPSSLAIPLAPLAHLLPTDVGFEAGFGVVQECLAALSGLSDGRPLLLGVDDAHLLDDLTTLVLHQAVVSGTALVVGTVRSGVPVPEEVDQIWRTAGGARLELRPLDKTAVAELVRATLGGPVAGATTALVDEASGGSPLLVLELLFHGRETGRLTMESGLWHWSGGLGTSVRLRELVGFALDQLDGPTRELLELVAVGEPLPARIVELNATPATIAELDRRGLLAPGAQPGTVRPGHPLIAEQIIEGIGALRRRQLLGRLVASFEKSADSHPLDGGDVLRVAMWSLDCDHQLTTSQLRSAARLALARQAPEEATRLARAAFAQRPEVATGLLLGRTLHSLGRYEEAEVVNSQIDAGDADPAEQVELVMNRWLTLRFGLGRLADADALLAANRERSEELRLNLMVAEARADVGIGDLDTAIERWEGAAATDVPDAVRYQLAEWACGAYALAGRSTDSGATLLWATQAAARCGDVAPTVPAISQFWWVLGLGMSGDVATAAALAEPFYEAAVREANRVRRAYGAMACLSIDFHRADLATAERRAREATLLPPTSKLVRLAALAALARILVYEGRIDEAASVLAEAEAERDPALTAHDELLGGARALVLHHRGNRRDAVEQLAQHAATAEALGQRLAAVHLLFDLVFLGYAPRATAALGRLAPVVEGPFASLVAQFACAAADGDPDRLAAVAADAVDQELRMVAIGALTSAVSVERARGRTAAAAQLEQRRATVLDACSEVAVPPARVELGLTEREQEVASLAARQIPDKVIAAQLGISVRTVNAHLRSVFAKLGITSRAELAAVVAVDADR